MPSATWLRCGLAAPDLAGLLAVLSDEESTGSAMLEGLQIEKRGKYKLQPGFAEGFATCGRVA